MNKSSVMVRAGELRNEGYDASEALSQAWEEQGKSNPISDVVENAGESYGALVLALVAGYLGWCYYQQRKTGKWSWTPWSASTIERIASALDKKPADNHQVDSFPISLS